MNAELLLAHYDRISDAPDAVARLRKFVLDLAVRGKLVEPTQGRLFVSRLIKEIKKETAERAEHGAKSPQLQFQEIAREDAPFRVPPSWTWIRFGCLVIGADAGWSPKAENFPRVGENWGVLKVSAVSWDRFLPSENKQLLPGIAPPEAAQIHKGDFLISRANTSELVAKSVVVEIEPKNLILSDKIVRLKISRSCNMKFLNMVNNHAGYARAYYAEEASGTSLSMKNVSRSVIYNLMVPLPSMEEQDRIIAKVDELMALCDRLEASQREQETRREQLTASAHHHLNNGGDAEELRTHAQFFIGHLPHLTKRPDQIKQLRQTILNLAVRGKLVSQNTGDEPASSILERIRTERMKRKGSKRNDGHIELSKVDVAQAPFELPSGWTWSRFLDLGTFGRGKSKHRPRNDASLFRNGTHFLIQTGDVARSGGSITSYTNKYNEVGLAQSMEWPKGTLCITIAANIADSGILTFDACFPDSVVGFVPDPIFQNARYFEYFVRTAKANLFDFAPATAQKNINLEILNAVLIPLPPLAEQHRIVAKVDELIALCDQLESSLSTAQTDTSRLLESVLHHALEASA